MKITIPMREALADGGVLAHAMVGPSWSNWRVLLVAASGGSLSRAERKIYKSLTGRDHEPGRMIDLFLGVVGRRGGKSRAMSVFMVWLATCVSWDDCLSLGERGIALIIAPSERQAQITEQYIRSIIDGSPLLASLVEDRTQHVLSLRGQVGIEVMAANSRTVRGITAIGILMDETAYLPCSEDSQNSDISILEAVRPCVSTTSAPVLMCSSPATMVGVTYGIWRKHYGPNGSPDVIVVQSDTKTTNPKFKQGVLDRALEEDGGAEYSGQFKEPLTAFLSRPIIEACVQRGVTERAAVQGANYQCRIDAAGGSGKDSFAAVIGHKSNDLMICDKLLEWRPPFDPLAVITELAGHLKAWSIIRVEGDGWAFNFVASALAKFGITYQLSKLSTSELYIAAAPAFTSRTISLLDDQRLVDQLANLRRRIGSAGAESIQHMRGLHDDLACCIAGLIHILTPLVRPMPESWDIPGAITAPRVNPADPNNATDLYMRRSGYGVATWPTSGQRSIHNGDAPVKGSPMSNGNAVY